MLNFIIYEDSQDTIKLYTAIIRKFIGEKKNGYNIISFERYNENLENKINSLTGKKIYILDISVPGKNGLDFARQIRASGDWLSQIIMISEHEAYRKYVFTSKTLTLDFIFKDNQVSDHLKETLQIAYSITNTQRSFSFLCEGDLYQIPYQDIFYFEKDLNDNYSSVITKHQKFKIKRTISSLEKELENDPSFMKTHCSCIINIDNVEHVNLSTNTIYFHSEKSTNLLSRDHKKELKEKLTKKKFLDKK